MSNILETKPIIPKGYVLTCERCGKPALVALKNLIRGENVGPADIAFLKDGVEVGSPKVGDIIKCKNCGEGIAYFLVMEKWKGIK